MSQDRTPTSKEIRERAKLDMALRLNSGRDALRAEAIKFARGAFNDNHAEIAIGILLNAAWKIAGETQKQDFAIHLLAAITGATVDVSDTPFTEPEKGRPH